MKKTEQFMILTGNNLKGADLKTADLKGVDLKGVDTTFLSLFNDNFSCKKIKSVAVRAIVSIISSFVVSAIYLIFWVSIH